MEPPIETNRLLRIRKLGNLCEVEACEAIVRQLAGVTKQRVRVDFLMSHIAPVLLPHAWAKRARRVDEGYFKATRRSAAGTKGRTRESPIRE